MAKQSYEVKELRPKDPDAKYFGEEPRFDTQPEADKREWALAKSFGWYNRFYGRSDAKEFICQYLDLKGQDTTAKLVRKVPDSQIRIPFGWLARVTLRGFEMPSDHQTRFDDEVARLISLVKVEVQDEVKIETSNRPNVQEIMRERTLEVGGELEGMWDEYLKADAQKNFELNIVDVLRTRNILPQHVGMLISAWEDKLAEYQEVLAGEDEQLNEAYSRFTKHQVKNIIRYIEQVIADLNSYISVKKAAKKPRAKKPIPVEKLVRRLKYLKAFKDEQNKLDLTSVHPTKLHGCSEAWVYDTKKRKLHHYVADEYSKSIGVKGNTVIGFCTKESKIKALRKPAEQLKQIMGSKPAARKFFKEIKAVEVTPNGRFNPNLVILKAF